MTDPNWRKRPRYWTPDKLFKLAGLIEQGWSDERIGREFGKSAEAIQLARKRHGIKARRRHLMSARHIASLLGLGCAKTVTRWIECGYLRGRRGQPWGPYRQWYVTWDALLSFLENPKHWQRWDRERVTDDRLRWWLKTLPTERYLTLSEVADRYYVQTATVHSWIEKGYLPCVRHGNHVVPESALDGFVPPYERSKRGLPHQRWTPFEDRQLCRLRDTGLSWQRIGSEMGRSIGSVANRHYRLMGRRGMERAA